MPTSDPEYITAEEACEQYLRCTLPGLYNMRTRGQGPPASRVGRRLLFRRADLIAYIDAQREAS